MPVYADSVFMINALSNALLLYSYSFFYGLKRRHLRLIAASALGGIYAAFEAIFDLPHLLRVIVLIIIIISAFGKCGIIKHTSRLMLMCFAVEGITIAVVSMIGAGAELVSGGVVLFASEPVCAIIFISAYPLYCLGTRLIEVRRRYIRLRIRYRNKEVAVTALRDSGNLLRYHDKPVIMVAWDAVKELLDHESYAELRAKSDTFAIYRTVNGAGTVPIIAEAVCTADGEETTAAIGVVERKFKDRYSGIAGDL